MKIANIVFAISFCTLLTGCTKKYVPIFNHKDLTGWKIHGTEKISSDGDHARLESNCTVEIKIPLIGGKIEKLIVKEFEKGRPQYNALLRKFLQ